VNLGKSRGGRKGFEIERAWTKEKGKGKRKKKKEKRKKKKEKRKKKIENEKKTNQRRSTPKEIFHFVLLIDDLFAFFGGWFSSFALWLLLPLP